MLRSRAKSIHPSGARSWPSRWSVACTITTAAVRDRLHASGPDALIVHAATAIRPIPVVTRVAILLSQADKVARPRPFRRRKGLDDIFRTHRALDGPLGSKEPFCVKVRCPLLHAIE